MSIASVLGVDFGSQSICLTTIRGGSIEVICNDLSHRVTPNIASFTDKQRFLGESGLSKLNANFRNTIRYPSRFLGLTSAYANLHNETKWLTGNFLTSPDGQIGFDVRYQGKNEQFTPEAVVAMIFQHVAQLAKNNGVVLNDIVISVPSYYTEVERRAIHDAAAIAGLKVTRFLNDSTAAALSYGIFRKKEFTEVPRIVAFADMGHSKFSVGVVKFTKDKLEVLSHSFDRDLGARDFDWTLMEYFASGFEKQHGVNPINNPRARLKLALAVERARKQLSANSEVPVTVEYLAEDEDLNAMLTRDQFEEICASLLQRVQQVCKDALAKAGIDKVEVVELVGGATRIPIIQKILIDSFGVENVSKTLNADETISRGCAIQAAMLSHAYKVQDFGIQDICSYPINIQMTPLEMDVDVEPEIFFTENNKVPIIKIIRPTTPLPLKIDLTYPPVIAPGLNQFVSKFAVLPPTEPIEDYKVKVTIKMNANGMVNIGTAEAIQTYYEEVPVKEEKKTEEVKQGEEGAEQTETPEQAEPQTQMKKRTRRITLETQSTHLGLDPTVLQLANQLELQMEANDRLQLETAHKKNELESYVYDWRDKLNSSHKPYVLEQPLQHILNLLRETEDWLYADGRETTKEIYHERLQNLKELTQPIHSRFQAFESIPNLFEELDQAVKNTHKLATNQEEKYSHISQDERESIIVRCQEVLQWLIEKKNQFTALKTYEDPAISSDEIVRKGIWLTEFANQVMNKPKPAPPKEETKENTEVPQNGEQAESQAEQGAQAEPMEQDEQPQDDQEQVDMELDQHNP